MTPSWRRKIRWLGALALLVLVGSFLVLRWVFPPFSPPVLPTPNGYDELLRAAMMLAPRTGFYAEMPPEELAQIVEQNQPALEFAGQALQKECMVPVNWRPGPMDLDAHLQRGSSLRGLARAFAAAARQANSDGRMEDAVQCGLDALQLGVAAGRGGLMVDRDFAAAIQYNTLFSLRRSVAALTRDDCLDLQAKLNALRLVADDPKEVLRREAAYFGNYYGKLQMIMMSGVMRSQRQQWLDRMQQADQRVTALLSILQTHLALRAYQLDKKQLPTTLEELTPLYLTEAAQDPFAVGPLKYVPRGETYLLYSFGENKIDDHGVETTSDRPGDLLLEAND